ncbi:MAG TPA: cation diffusion facilitator family transporter [Dehalococcoidia bacterium]|nr:cation diffusion facilitator family transporter [Dehalococcoidia bacterium]
MTGRDGDAAAGRRTPIHDHSTGAEAGHEHDHGGPFGPLLELLPFGHSHRHAPEIDSALEAGSRGMRALLVSVLVLGATAAFQVVITLLSGSAALLTDTLHNFSDALTALPLWIAFWLARKPPSRRYTYGYGRAEDIAGVIIVAFILASAVLAGYESIRKLLDPQGVDHVEWVILAGFVGFLGNEAVALYRTRVGREIGSAALVADGQHARVDGLTSLAVVAGGAGVWAGFTAADGLAGLAITAVIVLVLRDTALMMWYRLMDAVDPELVARIEDAAAVPGVEEVGEVRVRWVGHRLYTDIHIRVDEDMPTRESHEIAEDVRHALLHAAPQLAVVHVHVDPCGHSGIDAHARAGHHR